MSKTDWLYSLILLSGSWTLQAQVDSSSLQVEGDPEMKAEVVASDSTETNLLLNSPFLENSYYFITDRRSKNPRAALFLGLGFPGAGQMYNRDWFKLPFVYFAVGGVMYSIDRYSRQYKSYDLAYKLRIAGRPDEYEGRFSEAQLKSQRDYYRKRVELSYIGAVAAYAFIVIDAFVQAHLSDFDVSDDLSVGLLPQENIANLGLASSPLSIGLVYRF